MPYLPYLFSYTTLKKLFFGQFYSYYCILIIVFILYFVNSLGSKYKRVNHKINRTNSIKILIMKEKLFMKKCIQHFIYGLFFLLLGGNLTWGQTTVTTFNADGTWTCPAGVTSIQVEAWGAGGGGGGASSSLNFYSGAGGAGGNYARNSNIAVTPGTIYNIKVGAGGTGGTTSSSVNPYGANGGTSSFGTVLYASGGTGGYGGMTNNKIGVPGKNGGIYNIVYNQNGATWTVAPTTVVGTAWAATTAYVLNQQLSNDGKLYTVTVAGTTNSTAPVHTTGAVACGTATLTYAGEAATVAFSATNFTYIMTMNPGSGYLVAPPIVISGTFTGTTPPIAVAFINPINVTGADTYFIGGNGALSTYISKDITNSPGGGGGSAGTQSNGNNAVLNIGGIAVTGGTAGASAPQGADATGFSGQAASSYGGGGSGARGPSQVGGAGGKGKVVITISDNIVPNPAGAVVVSNPTNSSAALSWGASSSNDIGGYLVVRYSSIPNANNDPTQKAIFIAGQTITAGTGSLTGTVVYAGSSLGFVDTGLSALTSYYYKVYAYDASYNYADESSVTATTTNQLDNTPPGVPGVVSISNQTTSSLTTSWQAASSIDGGGYLVVRYSGTPEVDSDPIQKTIYAIGDTYATGTPVVTDPVTAPKVAKVVYVGTDLSFVNTALTSGRDYYFKVYTFDQASNYSEESSVKGRTTNQLIAPIGTAATQPNASGFTANWQSVPDATGYDVSLYTSAASVDNIVAWTIPANIGDQTALTANIATANNTTKVLKQNSNGTIDTTVSGNPGFAARGATYYSTSILSGSLATNDVQYNTPKPTPDKYWQVEVNTVGYQNVTVSSQQYSTNTLYKAAVTADPTAVPPVLGSAEVLPSSGPRDFKLQYGLDGESGTFTDVPDAVVSADEFWTTALNTNTSGDLSNIQLPTVCNNRESVLLRWVQTSFIGVNGSPMTTPDTGGTSRIDNIYVKGKKLSVINSASVVGNLTLSKSFTGLTPGNQYFYGVVATGTNTTDGSNVLTSYKTSANSNLVLAQALDALQTPLANPPFNSSATGFSASWDVVEGAKDYSVYVYNANTQSNIVGWTFPDLGTVLKADITSVNNTTNAIFQSSTLDPTKVKGTISSGVGATTAAISAASWYSQAVATPAVIANPNAVPPIVAVPEILQDDKYWEVSANTLGYRNVKISSKLYSTAPRDFKLQYKIGVAGTYADVPNGVLICKNNWTDGVFNALALPAECDNQPSIYLRWVNYTRIDYLTGKAMVGGTARLDDIYVTGALLASEPAYPITVSGNTTTFTDLPPSTYYFDVVANPLDSNTYAPSFHSNLVTIGPITAPVATDASYVSNTGFTANWDQVLGASDYDLKVYKINPTQNTVIGWTFPTTWIAGPVSLVADAYTATNNSITNIFSQSNGTVTPVEGNLVDGFAASGATYYSNLGSGVTLDAPAKYWQVIVNTKSRFNLKVSSKQWSSIDAEVLYSPAVPDDPTADPPIVGHPEILAKPATSGPRDFKLQYSVTGVDGPYIDVDNGAITVGNDWTSGVLDRLQLPRECENQEKLYLRWSQATFTDLNSTPLEFYSGSNRIDDILVEGSSLELVKSYPSLGNTSSFECSGLDEGQTYFYAVIAKSPAAGFYPSANSNLIKTTNTGTLGLVSFKSFMMKAYPNPVTNGKLFISSPNSSEKQVAVYSILGQKVLDTKTTNNAEINVSKLARGMYILKISEDGKSEAKKLIIQ